MTDGETEAWGASWVKQGHQDEPRSLQLHAEHPSMLQVVCPSEGGIAFRARASVHEVPLMCCELGKCHTHLKPARSQSSLTQRGSELLSSPSGPMPMSGRHFLVYILLDVGTHQGPVGKRWYFSSMVI